MVLSEKAHQVLVGVLPGQSQSCSGSVLRWGLCRVYASSIRIWIPLYHAVGTTHSESNLNPATTEHALAIHCLRVISLTYWPPYIGRLIISNGVLILKGVGLFGVYKMFGEKLLIKMWETLTKDGIGSLASPWQIKRQGKAHAEVRRDELLLIAQAESDADDIKQGRKKLLSDGRLIELNDNSSVDSSEKDDLGRIEPLINLNSLSSKIDQQKNAEEIQQEININKTILLAEDELLRSNQEPPQENVDPDWIYRWRDYAKSTQSEELRKLWARTLAGEVKSPGRYSLRTLEFIKNLSQDEALAISTLGQFVINNTIFKTKRLEEFNINMSFLLQMDDLGILNGVQGGQVAGLNLTMPSIDSNKYINSLINRSIILLIEHDDPAKKMVLDCYQVSRIGVELLSLGDFKADRQYMEEIGNKIKSQGFNVKLGDWMQTSATHGQYFNAIEL